MRPLLLRPKLKNIGLFFQQQLILIEQTGDEAALKQALVLKKLMLDMYLGLINMNDDISYADWAGHMMVAITRCAGMVMRMNLMKHTFELIFSLYSYLTPLSPQKKLQKYRIKYNDGKITYKDLYDISVEFSNSWGTLNELFNMRKETMTVEEVMESVMRMDIQKINPNMSPVLKRHGSENALLRETQMFIVEHLWRGARISYYRLKSGGFETYDFDVLFQNSEPPLPDSVFNHLLLKYENVCGWLPVGDIGLFSDEQIGSSEERLLANLNTLYHHIGASATYPVRWSVDETEDGIQVTNTAKYKGTRQVTPKIISPGKMVIDGSVLTYKCPIPSPNEREFPTVAMDYVGEIMEKHRVHDISDLVEFYVPQAEKPLYNSSEFEHWLERASNYYSYGNSDYTTLLDKGFFMLKHVKDGVFIRPAEEPDDLMSHIKGLQNLKEFHFFKGLFDKPSGDTSGGLFTQACIDYCNKFDPIYPRNGDDWVTWNVSWEKNTPCIINDKRLFVSEPTSEDKSIVYQGRHYRVTGVGTVCYAYTHKGEPLVVTAQYCEKIDANQLPKECFMNIQEGFHRNQDTLVIKLPVLSLSPKLSWRGHEIVNFDVSYWHKQLGHLNLKGLKKYIPVIKGMPPLLWPFRIRCEECYGRDEPKMDSCGGCHSHKEEGEGEGGQEGRCAYGDT
ncbi:YALI0C22022p [Yarrowia lipolytica CLIB122]|uniref:YALI0C22022p n=2 Tax=Yarrowia lipolytica TaxID=4952 RepID=Q6CB45_YARLI|nr:YALI0C22022p [Yarrowia lipolytica CLIB122]AOW03234.1 hypothetical protein YALI1_C30367g [Yarrowia lipolytica]KAJ8053728.1 hypothetical protein LXG23DRAFT_49924 [Yarrowia lipolytica]CAG82437.1 YALI0C22022p [Yarrowia lipolytica CLIB122]|eukprot:XP_502117.1 YALI0C22022p [Yarrowia lipolytica CLIB122]